MKDYSREADKNRAAKKWKMKQTKDKKKVENSKYKKLYRGK